MTLSKPTLKDFLNQNDFAELATEQKRQQLIKKKEDEDRVIHEEEELQEQKRLDGLPKITEEDLKKAEETGYENGFQAGQTQATTALNTEFEANLGKMQENLSHMPTLLKEEVSYIQKESLTFLKKILNKTLQNAKEKYSEEVLEFMLDEALSKIPDNTQVIVRLSSADRFYLQDKGHEAVKNSFIKFKEDETIKRGDCIIEWDNSGVDARFNNILNEINTFIQAAQDHITPKDVILLYKEEEQKEALAAQNDKNIEKETIQNHEEAGSLEAAPIDETSIEKPEKPQEVTKELPVKEENSSEDVTSADKNKAD